MKQKFDEFSNSGEQNRDWFAWEGDVKHGLVRGLGLGPMHQLPKHAALFKSIYWKPKGSRKNSKIVEEKQTRLEADLIACNEVLFTGSSTVFFSDYKQEFNHGNYQQEFHLSLSDPSPYHEDHKSLIKSV